MLPRVTKSLEELWAEDFQPYLKVPADLVMVGHLLVPAIDPDRPSSRSEKTIRLLRDEIGFDGVIVTDSVVMAGFFEDVGLDEAVVQAVEVGCDIVMLAGKAALELSVDDVVRIHGVLVEAVRSGRIPEEQIDTSVERIKRVKEMFGM